MTKITRITTQKRNKHRYNIFIDHGKGERYGFSVDEDILIEFNLRKDLEIDEAMMATLLEQDTLHQSYAQVLRYLSYRMRSEKEIREYLTKKEVDKEQIHQIIEKLISRQLIDDTEFAKMFVNTRLQTSTKGPSFVKKELLLKGISEPIARQAVNKYSIDMQYDKAKKIAIKKIRQSSKHSFYKRQQQLQATLLRNGFTQEIIKDVLADMQAEQNDQEEWDALIHHGERLLERHQRKISGHELRNKLKEGLYRQGFAIGLIDTFIDEKIEDDTR